MATVKMKDGNALDVSIKTITPQVAKTLLSTSFRNRKLKKSRVSRYWGAMKRDEWIVAQPIMLNCDGSLIDGQHRLQAVILHGKPVDFLMIKGYERENTFGKIDDVGPRKLNDWLHIHGEELPDVLAQVIVLAQNDVRGCIPTGQRSFTFSQTAVEGVEFLEQHPEIRQSVVAPGVVNVLVSRGMSSFCHWKFAAVDRVVADAFFVDLMMGEKEGETDPVYLLRERLKSNRLAASKLTRTEKLALIYKTWNAIRTGKKSRTLAWCGTGKGAEDFPEVI